MNVVYHAIIRLKLGALDLNTSEHIIDLVNTRVSSTVSQSVVINIYDDTALVIEAEILKGNNEMELSYGYGIGQMSKVYKAKILKYNLEFVGQGAILTIEGTPQPVVDSLNTGVASYKNMRLHEIVRLIAKQQKWEEGSIAECQPVYVDTTKGETSGNEMSFNKENESISEFVTKKLIPYAISVKTGEGNYCFRMETTGTKTKVYFMPDNWDQVPVKTFNYQYGIENERIISFKPEYNDKLSALIGGTKVVSQAQDPYTNEYVKTELVGDSLVKTITNEKSDSAVEVKRTVAGSSYSLSQMDKLARNVWAKAVNMSYPATMELRGDVDIEPMKVISVIVLTKDGMVHHSSGAYLVQTVEDRIEGGAFTTTLSLVRNASSGANKVSTGKSGTKGYEDWDGDSSLPEGTKVTPIVKSAASYIGTEYVLGGNSRQEGVDCSSLVQLVYAENGIELPRTADVQATVGTSIPYTDDCASMKEGDLVFWNGLNSSNDDVEHVGIYIGNGNVIHAPHTGSHVKVQSIWNSDSQHVVAVKRVS